MIKNCVRVKICGISDLATALGVVYAGADALGFVFAPSPRRITPEQAGEISRGLPPFVSRVGVFVNPTREEVFETAARAGLDAIQLHGDETPGFCSSLGLRVIKSFAVAGEDDIAQVKGYSVDAYLLDTRLPGSRGGGGKTFDWRLAADFRAGPLILAGGLTPENVREAVEITSPYAVDVSSGVERDGKKDLYKITEFIRRVKG